MSATGAARRPWLTTALVTAVTLLVASIVLTATVATATSHNGTGPGPMRGVDFGSSSTVNGSHTPARMMPGATISQHEPARGGNPAGMMPGATISQHDPARGGNPAGTMMGVSSTAAGMMGTTASDR